MGSDFLFDSLIIEYECGQVDRGVNSRLEVLVMSSLPPCERLGDSVDGQG